MATYTLKGNKEVTGTNKADTATISGNNNYFWGQGGNDTITVSSGKNNRGYGNAGNDKIYLKGGSDNCAYGVLGTNTMQISGGRQNNLYGGAGKDYLSITGKGSYHYIHGAGGADSITVNATSTNDCVYGEAGNDIINVKKAGKGLRIEGGAGKDTITVRNTATWQIYGSNSLDNISDSADTIKVFSGKGTVAGNGGNDKITLGKGVKNGISADGDAGNDIITVNYGNSHKIEGGKGQDTIKINKGTGHTLDADSNDIITLARGTGANTINIENGVKTILEGKVTLNSGSKAKLILDNDNHKYSNKLTITAANGTVTDNTLYFTGQYQTAETVNYTFRQSGSSLVINDRVYIANFDSGAYSGGFTFSCDNEPRYQTHMTLDEVKSAANWK